MTISSPGLMLFARYGLWRGLACLIQVARALPVLSARTACMDHRLGLRGLAVTSHTETTTVWTSPTVSSLMVRTFP